MAIYHQDTFTGSDGTLLTSHTPEVGGAYTSINGAFEIQSNKLAVNTLSGGNVAATLDPGQTEYMATVVFTVPTISTDSGERTLEFHFRRIDGSNYNIVQLIWQSGSDTSDATFTVRNVFFPASGGVIGSGTASLAAGVSHTLVLVVTSTTIVATIDGNSTGTITDSINNTGTLFSLQFFLTTTTTSVPVFDSLAITSIVLAGVIQNATNECPIVITTTDPHGIELAPGATVVTLSGVIGNLAANGTFFATYIDTTTFYLCGSQGNGDFVESPDSVFTIVEATT